jgi:hypothetical protein
MSDSSMSIPKIDGILSRHYGVPMAGAKSPAAESARDFAMA